MKTSTIGCMSTSLFLALAPDGLSHRMCVKATVRLPERRQPATVIEVFSSRPLTRMLLCS